MPRSKFRHMAVQHLISELFEIDRAIPAVTKTVRGRQWIVRIDIEEIIAPENDSRRKFLHPSEVWILPASHITNVVPSKMATSECTSSRYATGRSNGIILRFTLSGPSASTNKLQVRGST